MRYIKAEFTESILGGANKRVHAMFFRLQLFFLYSSHELYVEDEVTL